MVQIYKIESKEISFPERFLNKKVSFLAFPTGCWISLPTDSMRTYFDLCIIKYFLNIISPEMTCWTRCRHSSQDIPKLPSAHRASHQATGRMSHCGAPDDEDRDGIPLFLFSFLILSSKPHICTSKQVKIVKSSLSLNLV